MPRCATPNCVASEAKLMERDAKRCEAIFRGISKKAHESTS
jgi:hypothetical protein